MAAKGFIELIRLASQGGVGLMSHSTDGQTDIWSGVCFECGGENFVFPIGEVKEVVDFASVDVSTVFGVQAWVKGVTYIRGMIAPVVDFGAFLSLPVLQPPSMLVVIEQSDLVSGLAVDKLAGVQHFNSKDYTPNLVERSNITSKWQRFSCGSFVSGATQWHVLLPSILVQDYQFAHPVQQ